MPSSGRQSVIRFMHGSISRLRKAGSRALPSSGPWARNSMRCVSRKRRSLFKSRWKASALRTLISTKGKPLSASAAACSTLWARAPIITVYAAFGKEPMINFNPRDNTRGTVNRLKKNRYYRPRYTHGAFQEKNSIFDNNGQPGTGRLNTRDCQMRAGNLSVWTLHCNKGRNKKTPGKTPRCLISLGGRYATRTHDLWLRRPTLYPTELTARCYITSTLITEYCCTVKARRPRLLAAQGHTPAKQAPPASRFAAAGHGESGG